MSTSGPCLSVAFHPDGAGPSSAVENSPLKRKGRRLPMPPCNSANPPSHSTSETQDVLENAKQAALTRLAELESYVSARAFGVAEANSGRLIAGCAVEETLEIASITKVCVCVCVCVRACSCRRRHMIVYPSLPSFTFFARRSRTPTHPCERGLQR
jgi:hypothetical protein